MKTKTKLSFKALLDQTKRKQYVTDSVVEGVEPAEAQELEFVKLDKYVEAKDLEGELAKLGYTLAHPYALALYAAEHPEFADGKSIATQWQDKEGDYCYAAFDDWDGKRNVRVGRSSDGWDDGWLFACSRQVSGPSTLGSLTLDSAIKMVKDAGFVIYKPV